jgi:hypothetical protein
MRRVDSNAQSAFQVSPEDFTYVFLPGQRPTHSPASELHHEASEYFAPFWERVLAENGVTEGVASPRSFTRSDLITVLLFKGSFVGLIAHSFLDLREPAHRTHEYLQGIAGPEFLKRLDQEGITRAMTMEWLTIHHDFRKKRIGVSLAPVMLALSLRTQREFGMQVTLQRARQDIGIDRILKNLGAEVILENILMHNTPVAMMMTFTEALREDLDTTTLAFVESCWKRRLDLREPTATTVIERAA